MAATMYKADEMYEARRHFNVQLSSNMIKSLDEYNQKWKSMLRTVSEQEVVDANLDAEVDFYKSFKKMYPKTLKKRMKIITQQIKVMLAKIDEE